jgi:ADP-ribosylglycohydrolase
MRAAPVGTCFAGDLGQAAGHGALQSAVTHAHPEGIAGGVAVAVAASLHASPRPPTGTAFLRTVLAHVPPGETADRIHLAGDIPATARARAARELGTGRRITAQDTVPFCLWCVAHHSSSFEEALWTAIASAEDGDTICAIVGGIIGVRLPPPNGWIEAREALPTLEVEPR